MNNQTTPSVGFVEAGKLYFQNATNFKGRARRSEYWMAILFLMAVNAAGAVALGLIMGLLGDVGTAIGGLIYLVWGIYCVVASLSLCVRRLHDIGKSGWWYLLCLVPFGSIVLIVFFCKDSEENNQWGPNPKMVPREKRTFDEFVSVVQPLPQPAPLPPTPPAPTFDPTVYEPIPSPAPAPAPAPAPVFTPASQLQAVVQMQTGPMAGKSFRFSEGSTVTVGRNPSKCDLALPAYGVVSGTHCKIHFGNRVITIVDLNSTNGTFVNNIKLTPGKPGSIKERAVIQLANNTCTMKVWFE